MTYPDSRSVQEQRRAFAVQNTPHIMTAQEIEEYLAGPDVERQRQLDIATLDAEHNVIVGWNAAIDAAVAHLNKNGIEHNAVEISLMKK